VDPRKAFAAVLGALVGWCFGVDGEDAEGGEEELGEIAVAELSMLPEALTAVGDSLQNELDRPQCDLPADKKAEIPPHVGAFGGYGQSLEVEDGFELGEQGDDGLLVGVSVASTCIDLVEREAAQQLQDDIVDVAPEGKISPGGGQPQEE